MVHLGWTDINNNSRMETEVKSPGELDSRLQSCLSRYNAFVVSLISLMSEMTDWCDPNFELSQFLEPCFNYQSSSSIDPTFDIDLAWKTDRLRGIEYTESMMQTNRNLINHPNELGLDKSKFLAHFRLTLLYGSYPAPYLKIDRRQDWLKKAIKELDPPTESIPTIKDAERARSLESSLCNQQPRVDLQLPVLPPAPLLYLMISPRNTTLIIPTSFPPALGSKTRSSRIQSDFSTSSANQTKIDKRNEYPNPVERCTPSRPQLGAKTISAWPNHPSLHIQAIRGEAPTFSKVPTTPETSPSTFAKLPPANSSHQSISKRKLAIIEPVDLDFADNNFIIPVGKIAFVEDGNRLRCL
ncbi:hypothetical protein H4Q26_015388 [Puccinia striiformis f. sp. tritici PST-130]|nr:hypothetical protein H4Q26_015388 [Puccinia striiformis f. sp. tritici PST-130]